MSYGDPRYSQQGRGLLQQLMMQFGWRLIPIFFGILAVGFTMLRGCERGPFGRNRVLGVKGVQEMALGDQAFREVLASADVVTRGADVAAVEAITKRLIQATNDPTFLKLSGLQPVEFKWQLPRRPRQGSQCLLSAGRENRRLHGNLAGRRN